MPGSRATELSSRKGDFQGLPEDDEEDDSLEDETLKDDAVFLAEFAIPFALSTIGFTVMGLIALAFIGRLGTTELAAVSYAQIWMNFSVMMLFVPTSAALESLVAQAVGAGSKVLTGVWLQISLICSLGLTIPIAVTWIWIGPFMHALGAGDGNPKHTAYATTYAIWSIPSLPALVAYTVIEAWFQSMEIVLPSAFCCVGALVATVGCNALFIFVLDMGVKGAALATSVAAWVQLFSYLFMVIVVSKYHRDYWAGIQLDKLFKKKRWYEYTIKQLLPQFGGTALDELHNMGISFVAATFGPAAITAHNITFQVVCLLFTLPMAVMIATGVRIGNYLGANLPKFGKRMSMFSLVVTAALGLIIGIVYYFLRHQLALLVMGSDTTGPEAVKVLKMVDQIGIPTAVNLFSYSLMSSGLGTLDGQARPYTVGLILAFGGWGVSIPIAIVLKYAVPNLGLRGTWWAEAAGYSVASILVLVILFQTDWKYQAKLAIKRAEEEEEEEKRMFAEDSDIENSDTEEGSNSSGPGGMDGSDSEPDETTNLNSRAYLKQALHGSV